MKTLSVLLLVFTASEAWSQDWEAGLSGGLTVPLVSPVLAPAPPGLGAHSVHPQAAARLFLSGWTGLAAVGFRPAYGGNFEDGYETADSVSGTLSRIRYQGRFEHPGTLDIALAAGRSADFGGGFRAAVLAGLGYSHRLEGGLRLTGRYTSSEWDGSTWTELETGPLEASVPVDQYFPLGFLAAASGDWKWDFLTLSLGARWQITSLEELLRGFMPRQELAVTLSAFYRL